MLINLCIIFRSLQILYILRYFLFLDCQHYFVFAKLQLSTQILGAKIRMFSEGDNITWSLLSLFCRLPVILCTKTRNVAWFLKHLETGGYKKVEKITHTAEVTKYSIRPTSISYIIQVISANNGPMVFLATLMLLRITYLSFSGSVLWQYKLT